jgi:hypothetical protein
VKGNIQIRIVILDGCQHEVGCRIQAIALQAKMRECAGVGFRQYLPATLADCFGTSQPGDGRALGR